ncbi:MAG TPA: DNA polymerase Y family protein [Ramlibacter sp.]|nr:DNA polymerase Y family protein [Ramlibacter sp.]
MYWIALLPSREEERIAWGWRALQFTPRVAQVDEALLLEASGSLRLWGGRKALVHRLLHHELPLSGVTWAQGGTARVALAWLRLQLQGSARPARIPDDFPLEVLSAAQPHVPTLERTGCRTWGGLRALPRPGVARRFGAEVLEALDLAYGDRPEQFPWLQLPEEFDLKYELAALATTAGELMWSAQRLLGQLQVWLQARHRGVLALELEWTLDLRRLNGQRLPSHEQLVVRTAQPTQDIAHLRRLVGEHLARAALSAPANHLRLRTLETLDWAGASKSLLPEDNVQGEKLHQLVERLSVRLGEANVLTPKAHADHRPERMQRWVPARQLVGQAAGQAGGNEAARVSARQACPSDSLYPTWLLSQPLRLEVRGEKPHYHGPLRLLAGPRRLETGWWGPEPQGAASRDYFIARSEEAGLLWVYRERLQPSAQPGELPPVRWFLHGLYA